MSTIEQVKEGLMSQLATSGRPCDHLDQGPATQPPTAVTLLRHAWGSSFTLCHCCALARSMEPYQSGSCKEGTRTRWPQAQVLLTMEHRSC